MLPAPSAQLVGEDALEGPQLRQGCPGLLQLGLGKLPGGLQAHQQDVHRREVDRGGDPCVVLHQGEGGGEGGVRALEAKLVEGISLNVELLNVRPEVEVVVGGLVA